MHRYSYIFIATVCGLLLVLGLQVSLLSHKEQSTTSEKKAFVRIAGLPDLAIANGANFIRHRSLSDTFSLFSNGPELLEFFPSTFTYMYSPSIHQNPSKIDYAP